MIGRHHRRWLRERWPALTLAALAVPIVVVAAVDTLHWPGRTFPGFFVMGNRLVPTIGLPGWTGIEAHVPFHAQVVAVEDVPVASSRAVYAYTSVRPPGTPVRYTFAKGGRTTTLTVATMRFGGRDYWLTVGLYLVFALTSIGTGVAVGILQPRTRAARAFLVQGVCTGVFALTGAALYGPSLWWLSPLHLLMQAAFPAAFIHLGLVFPVERRFVARRPEWIAVPYVLALAIAAWAIVGFYAEPPALTGLYCSYYFTALAIVTLIALATWAYVEDRSPQVRSTLHAVLPGLVVGTVVALYGFLNISRGGGDFLMNLIALGPAFFYLSVGYAILRHDLFAIDRLVRQAVVYAVLTLAITGGYAGSLAAVGWLAPSDEHVSPLVTIAFVVLMAFVLQPFRERVQRVVDRTFFRGRPDYRRTVGDVSAALTSVLDRDEILSRVGRALVEGLQVGGARVVLAFGDATAYWRYDPRTGGMAPLDHPPGADAWIDAPLPRQVLVVPDDADDDDDATRLPAYLRELAHALAARVLVPLAIADRTIGAIGVAAKRSGRRFDAEDVALLQTLAAQTAIALQNAHSFREVAALNAQLEAKVAQRTAELAASNAELAASNTELSEAYRQIRAAQSQLVQSEKLASLGQLVAGVAHELNNPASFVHGGLANLVEYLDAFIYALQRYEALAASRPELREAIAAVRNETRLDYLLRETPELLRICAEGSERIKSIVADLRVFVRAEHGERKPTDVVAGIEASLRLLGDRITAGDVDVAREYLDPPLIAAHAGQLSQVWMNLLSNALDALDGRAERRLHIRVEGREDRPSALPSETARWVEIRIADSGCGMSREVLNRIFDPFFTTKTVGRGTGLGMSIAYGAVRSHGGTIEATSIPDRGTTVVVRLPVPHARSRAA
ncbi:MAG: hypothetical protein B6D46_00030 [Polyangiaceae bacterium UTPRO1]|jgi:signal transduction histidine kinase|nr:ATP-binding protein [Myxococcales bacterium]OQY69364.1 MAG: hypothetical protein B6D46_00030 [Polyangiaceae bacterium UTPRO1]